MDQILIETIRIAILLLVPIMVVASVAGAVVGLLQKTLRFEDIAFVLSFKSVAVVATLFVVIPNLIESLQSLLLLCLQLI
jgi:type III secretory pathway component EscS